MNAKPGLVISDAVRDLGLGHFGLSSRQCELNSPLLINDAAHDVGLDYRDLSFRSCELDARFA